jgi:hypothetical protein
MKLPHTLKTTLHETLRPELISVLQEHTRSNHVDSDTGLQRVHTTNDSAVKTNVDGSYKALSMDISALKREIEHSSFTQRKIEASLRGITIQQRPKFLGLERERLRIDQDATQEDNSIVKGHESLQEV